MKYICSLIFLVLALVTEAYADEVVVYTSLDQVFSEPVLQAYEKKTGIKVKAVYDVEASKTTGLVNRLIAEKRNPRADVFWNSEVGRTLVLKGKGVLTPYTSPSARDIPRQFKGKEGYWTGFAARARVLIYNQTLVPEEKLPKSIFDLTQPEWKGKVALAYPLFGTTATHVAAWYAVLGAERTEQYLRDLKANDVLIVNGNATSRDVVVQGEVPLGFTDTDDVNVAIQSGKPVNMIFPDKDGLGTLMIPNTIALIKGAPNSEQGKKLIDYLLSKKVEQTLAFSDSMQIPVRDGVDRPAHVPPYESIHAMEVDYQAIANYMDRASRFSRELFLR
ncbi:MAG: extracellular solute-binding protein [Pseudomonadota bacterium]